MKEGTIEIRYAFKAETQRAELEKDIADAVAPFGYEPVEGISSTTPGVIEMVFIKSNLKKKKAVEEPVVAKKKPAKKVVKKPAKKVVKKKVTPKKKKVTKKPAKKK